MIKNLGRQLRRVRNISGATILGDGQLVMVLNPADVLKSIQAIPSASLVSTLVSKTPARRRVLLADDSITTRSLEKHILENAGFQVSVAANGMEAWRLLNSPEGAGLDGLISDVNMPEMDGFELTAAIKADDRLSHLPVVLVTSLETQQDKLRGMDAGADAYIVKSSFDQRELLEALHRLIG
jgi:two-component system chemotaxis sensor kinase CheA